MAAKPASSWCIRNKTHLAKQPGDGAILPRAFL
jgi:hypothetical protein